MRICACALFLAFCLVASPQNGRVDDDSSRILALESAWNYAELKHDSRALSMLLAETFKYTDADGSFMNKSEWLTHVTKEADQYEQLGNSSMIAHVCGSAAVVTGRYREKINVQGKMVTRSGRFPDTWIHQNAEWRCVASQATLISP